MKSHLNLVLQISKPRVLVFIFFQIQESLGSVWKHGLVPCIQYTFLKVGNIIGLKSNDNLKLKIMKELSSQQVKTKIYMKILKFIGN
jgi:hypothetical protein